MGGAWWFCFRTGSPSLDRFLASDQNVAHDGGKIFADYGELVEKMRKICYRTGTKVMEIYMKLDNGITCNAGNKSDGKPKEWKDVADDIAHKVTVNSLRKILFNDFPHTKFDEIHKENPKRSEQVHNGTRIISEEDYDQGNTNHDDKIK